MSCTIINSRVLSHEVIVQVVYTYRLFTPQLPPSRLMYFDCLFFFIFYQAFFLETCLVEERERGGKETKRQSEKILRDLYVKSK